MSTVLGLIEHDRGVLTESSLRMLTLARQLGTVEAVLIGQEADGIAQGLGEYGVSTVHQVHHDLLTDFSPEAWGEALVQLVAQANPDAVAALGSERGNEVMAHVAARTDLPMVANCTEVTPGEPWEVVRVRWGGSLLEHASLDAATKLLTVSPFAFEAEPSAGGVPTTEVFTPTLDDSLARTRVVDRVTLAAGVTLATAPVVVSGGRGVGSAEGFGILEELADLLGGVVGCSRVATNNGWRNHSDQVGQTGTRVAPDLYIACGISGAIQHWVGMMASKKILAINTDPEAPMVTKADYAVIGDVHDVLPALVEEVKKLKQ